MSEQSLLQECRRYFPSLAWDFDEGGECTAHFYGIDFYLAPEIDRSFSVSILFSDKRWDWNQRGFPSAASALAAASARWQEFAALAMSVVGPVAEQKLKLYTVTASDVHDQWTSKPYTSMAEAEAVLSDIEGSYMSSGIEEHEVTLPMGKTMSHDRSACTGSFSSGAPCPAAGMCDRYRLGLASDSPRQVWSIFDADATGQRCDEFRESPPDRDAQARAAADAMAWAEDNPG